MRSFRLAMPIRARIILMLGLFGVIAGAGLVAYRYYTRPVTLSVAVGSIDGSVAKAAGLVAAHLVQQRASVRLRIVKTADVAAAARALAGHETDLAVVRADVGDLAQARAVALVGHAVVMLMVPPGSHITSMESLKGHVVGVAGGAINQRMVDTLRREYDLDAAKVTFTNLAPEQVRQAVAAKQVAAVLAILPLSNRYLALVRGIFGGAPKIIPIDSADAIADLDNVYESFAIPRGTFRGAPADPDDDVSSLRVGVFLVANKDLGNDLIADLTQAIMSARKDLVAQDRDLSGIASVDADTSPIPVHPGAAAYYDGTQETFMDRYGDAIYLTPMVIGALMSIFAGAWRLLGAAQLDMDDAVLRTVYELPHRIRGARGEAELTGLEAEIDELLKGCLVRARRGDESAIDLVALNSIAMRLDAVVRDQCSTLLKRSTERDRA